MKCGEIVGSPPENWTDIWRRGLIEIALSNISLISPTFSFTRIDTSCSPLRIDSRASITQFGQRESVTRGQPKVGFVFCQDFSSGLSDHFGVNDGLGLYLLTSWMESKRVPAIVASPRSAYLMGFINSSGAQISEVASSQVARLVPIRNRKKSA